MFRWHYVKYDGDGVWECGATGDLPTGNWVDCFCQLDNENIEFRLLNFMDGQFLDDQCVPRKVFRWCYVDDIAHALNDITRGFMQSEAVRKETNNG